MKNIIPILLITLFIGTCAQAQVKIGDNPQNIDPSSVLELESSDKVLVITRVTTAQMNAIAPSQGALCYNTEVQAVHYYNGTQWINIGSGGGGTNGTLTANGLEGRQPTILLTTTGTNNNIEVKDGSIEGYHIADGSIGPGKIQNASVTEEKLSNGIVVSTFNNDAGYLTAADLSSSVSDDLDNVIAIGTDGGAFYDDTPLMNLIDDNTDAINNIGIPTLNEVLQQGNISNSQQIKGLAAPTDPADAATKAYVDNNITKINDSPTVTVTGDGTIASPYVLTSTGGTGGADGSETIIDATNSTITVTGTGTNLDPYVLTGGSGNADGSETIIDATNSTITVTGTGTNLDPYVLTGGSGNADGSETIIDTVNSNLTITGTGTTIDPYVLVAAGAGNEQDIALNISTNTIDLLEDDGTTISSSVNLDGTTIEAIDDNGNNVVQLADDAVTLAKIDQNGANDGDAIIWDNTAGEWKVDAPPGEHTGTPKAVFYADPDGKPTTADDNANPNDDGGFVWNTNGRLVSSNTYGSLIIGGQSGSPNYGTNAKVVIAERITNGSNQQGLAFPLQIQNENGSNGIASAGILFAVEREGDFGKGSLAFERTGAWGVGDFHFLQNEIGDNSLPALTDKSFTIKNNKDIVLYGGIDVDATGTATGLGNNGQVLSSLGVGNGLKWVNAGTATTDTDTDDGLSDFTSGSGYDINVDDETIEIDTDALRIKPATPITPNNVDQMLITEEVTGDVIWTPIENGHSGTTGSIFFADDTTDGNPTEDNANLFWDDVNDRLGVGVNNPDRTLEVNGEAKATSFASAKGTAGQPAYSFYSGTDTDTGMFRIAADQLGFSTGGTEALRIDASQNVGIGPTFALGNPVLERLHVDGNIRAEGDILYNGAATDLIPDYVFQKYFQGFSNIKPNYDFRNLEDIEDFIRKNKHLPGIKSITKVKEDGYWNLSESNLLNLEKIEELFLHTIEQENKIKNLQTENATLKEQLEALRKSVQEIQTLLETKN